MARALDGAAHAVADSAATRPPITANAPSADPPTRVDEAV
jgi:hypothetical protein